MDQSKIEEILENFEEQTQYERLDDHSKLLFLLWCPFADFAIILVRYFKNKWRIYQHLHSLIFSVVNIATVYYSYDKLMSRSFIVFPYLTLS